MMKRSLMRSLLIVLALLLALAGLSGCKSVEEEVAEAFSLNTTETSINAGEYFQLEILDSLEGKYSYSATWVSENMAVAAVSDSGMVVGVSEGSTTINVTLVVFASSDVTLKLNCLVNVGEGGVVITGLSFPESLYSVTLGQTIDLKDSLMLAPEGAVAEGLTWTSATPTVATVENGVIMPIAEGVTNISVSTADGQFHAECVVRVTASRISATGISVSPASVTLKIGETSVLTASIRPEDATGYIVAWTSSNTNVVSVASGTLTGKSAGTATITATIHDDNQTLTATCTVTVTSEVAEVPATRVVLSPARIDIVIGEDSGPWYFTPTVTPSNTTQKGTWSCGNSDVLRIDDTGRITLVGDLKDQASIPIIVTYTVGGVSARAVVFVSKPQVTMAIDPPTLTLTEDGPEATAILTAKFSDSSTDTRVTWASSDSSVVTVESNGTVHAVAPGTATITATSVANANLTASCAVTVKKSDYITLRKGDTYPLDTQGITDPVWSKYDEYFTIDENNVLTALNVTNGPLTLICTSRSDNSKKVTYNVIINEFTDDASVTMLTESSQKIETGLASVSKWEVRTNTADAAFDSETGTLTTGEKEGTVVLVATSPSGATQKITVTVVREKTTFTLTPDQKSYRLGETVTLILTANRRVTGTLSVMTSPPDADVRGNTTSPIDGTTVTLTFTLPETWEDAAGTLKFVVTILTADGPAVVEAEITIVSE